ncbi:CU044_2847 family protein [Streptomyces tubercidicus]|uniref:CU044_2847 family protein n=1 Tax=Streptomyces tubercidicus TaxID=47759 RepID=UPI003530A6DF
MAPDPDSACSWRTGSRHPLTCYQLRAIAQSFDGIHVEFGLSLHSKAGAFIAAAGSTANFTVALTWRRNESRPTSD